MAAIIRYRRRDQIRRNRIFRDHRNPFDFYDDAEIYKKFRFQRAELLLITEEITDFIEHPNRRGALPPLLQVLLTLRFYATGSFQDVCAELIGVSQSTTSKTIRRVTQALLQTVHTWIVFPDQRAAEVQKRLFQRMRGVPNVVGCIDGTHVRIQRPRENEHEFVNRKNHHSINVQVVCNAQLIFTDIVARWPGSVHDSRILRQSALFRAFKRQDRPIRGLLLGDSGYMLREWLITPVPNPQTQQENNFNFCHSSTRNTVERSIGCAKRRWGCLKYLRVSPVQACDITTVCFMLHNRARFLKLQRGAHDDDTDSEFDSDSEDSDSEDNDDSDFRDDMEAENEDPEGGNITERARVTRGRVVRNNLIAQYF